MDIEKTLIIGASLNPARYAFLAAHRLIKAGHPVVLLGRDSGQIEGIPIVHSTNGITNIHTVTVYLNPGNQAEYEQWLVRELKPKRIIFNPGAENPGLAQNASGAGIEVLNACTLVLLSTGQY